MKNKNTKKELNTNLPSLEVLRPSHQLELWSEITSKAYSNAISFYFLMPRFVPLRGKDVIKLNKDGTTRPIVRTWESENYTNTLTITPAYVKNKEGKLEAKFPGSFEEILELVLFKLSVENGVMSNEGFGLVISIYEIRKELERIGSTRSFYEIQESLDIMSGVNYKLVSDNPEYNKLNFDCISDFGERTIDGEKIFYIRFNSLIDTQILKKNWRQFNYNDVVEHKSFLPRYLLKRLQLNFKGAAQNKCQYLLLSTIIMGSGLSYNSDIAKLKSNAIKALNSLSKYIVTPVEYVDIKAKNPKTNRIQTVDVKFIIYPTKYFQDIQIKNNLQAKINRSHRIDESGNLVKNPDVLPHLGFKDKIQAEVDFSNAEFQE